VIGSEAFVYKAPKRLDLMLFSLMTCQGDYFTKSKIFFFTKRNSCQKIRQLLLKNYSNLPAKFSCKNAGFKNYECHQ